MLDISPTRIMYARTDKAFATAYYHWFFLIQPFDLPERLIGADPVYYLHKKTRRMGVGRRTIFDPRALAEYERCFADPATIHATCEDYRAAASIDLEHDDGGRRDAQDRLPAARAVGRRRAWCTGLFDPSPTGGPLPRTCAAGRCRRGISSPRRRRRRRCASWTAFFA